MLNNAAIDRVFHALAEPTRRAIVERLSAGPSSVSELAAPFDMTLAAIVQHLQVLEQSGVIRTEKVGRIRTCRIEPAGLKVAAQWIAARRALWERRLDRLGDILAEDEPLPRPTSRKSKTGTTSPTGKTETRKKP
jgi:DNA-binding transcriptional ArsR family regulator